MNQFVNQTINLSAGIFGQLTNTDTNFDQYPAGTASFAGDFETDNSASFWLVPKFIE